ncbi:MAG: glycosyltransferase family 4 protein [Arenicellales bacterium]
MRVLLVTNVFPPAIGGPATFGARLAEELFQGGHKVKVVCATEDFTATHRFPFPVVRAGFSGNLLQREISLRMQLLKASFASDIIYCMGLEHQTAWASSILRKPFVLRIGGDSVWEGARNLGTTDLEPEAYYAEISPDTRLEVKIPEQRRLIQLKSAATVVYVSNYLKQLAGVWSSNRPVRECIIPNGISTNEKWILPGRKADKPMRLLFVGRQTNWKGVDAILLALRNIEGVKLTVAGSGPMLPANIDLARRLGLGKKVEFLGHVDTRGVEKLMTNHHVLILPSLYEGLSNTLLEAGAAGLACIASDRGGNPEVITHNETGLLVDPFTIEDIGSAIRLLSDNDEKRKQFAMDHRIRVMSEFTMEQSVKRTVQVLEDAISH